MNTLLLIIAAGSCVAIAVFGTLACINLWKADRNLRKLDDRSDQ